MANYDVGDALSRIETILLDSIGRNMKRHLKEESDLQKAWSMWQTEQLAGLGNWSAKNYKQFAPQFTKINNSAMNLLQQANQNGELNEEIRILQTGIQNAQRFFDVPNDKLDSLLKSVRSDLSRAEHSILRKADDVYREALFDSHFYLQSGTGTLNSAIDMAVSDMHQRGMNSIVYRNGAHVSASVYARMALRTANERAQLLGEGKARDKFGIHTVIVPPSGVACPKCAPWLCKVLVDDVYSAGTPAEADELKLPLLSEAIRQGFLHPQCNCSPQTYFPESPVPEMSDSQREEAVRKYRITQKQRYHERQIRKWKQAEKSAPDEASKKSASARKREWQKRCKNLCDQNSDFLRRDYFREKIYDNQTPPIVPNVIDKPTPPEPTPKITEAKPAVTVSESELFLGNHSDKNIPILPESLDKSAESGIIKETHQLYPEKIAGVQRGTPMTFEQADNQNPNPLYNRGGGYAMNCQSTVVAYEARLRGYPVRALPITGNKIMKRLAEEPRLAWIDPATGQHPNYIVNEKANTALKFFLFLNKTIQQGERYSFEFHWKNGGGHVVAVEKLSDWNLRIYDAQSGKTIEKFAVINYFKDIDFKKKSSKNEHLAKILRIDNMVFDLKIINEILEVGKS
ncbi:MAG: hypothetical protein E7496_08055 [Ruminococcus sp.]|nr:hypothetical protein [Ruminococcus sp.]